MVEVSFTIPIEPIPQPRPRFSKFGAYEPKRNTEYKKQVAQIARVAMGEREPINGAVAMTIKFYRKFQAVSRRFGDFDNLAKSITDALNKIVFVDDSQIVSCHIEKFTDKNFPRAEISVSEI